MKATANIITVLGILFSTPAWSQQFQMYDNRPRISVTGEAIVQVKPDKIVVTLGIETSDKSIAAAKENNNDILKKAIAAAKECGVADKDIQTDHLSIEPRWKSDGKYNQFIGYFVRNTLVVTLADPEKVEDLITKGLAAGVNYIHGIQFETTESRKHRDQARELALIAAKEKAIKMSAVLGKSIGDPIQISEDYNGSSWGGSGWGGRYQGMANNSMQVDNGGAGEITGAIALGMLSIQARVSVTFELKK